MNSTENVTLLFMWKTAFSDVAVRSIPFITPIPLTTKQWSSIRWNELKKMQIKSLYEKKLHIKKEKNP